MKTAALATDATSRWSDASFRKCRNKRFSKTDDVHRHRYALRKIENERDAATEFDAEAAADQVISAAALDASVGNDGRERKTRQAGNQFGAQQDEQGMSDAGLAGDLAEAQEHDDAEYRQHIRREDAAEGAEFGPRTRNSSFSGTHFLAPALNTSALVVSADGCSYGTPCRMACSASVSSRPR